MKLKTLSTAILLATVPMTGAFAAAMDRSGQSISAFLQPGNYFEAGISVLDPTVSGTANANGSTLADMGDDYYFPSAALKLQLTDHFSFGLLYDQPFGADATYSLTDPALSPTGEGLFRNATESTEVQVKSQNISMIFGFQPTENWNIYGGGVYQTVKGDLQLRGLGYGGASTFGSYNANIKEDGSTGWLAGFAYQIPDIALKASLTYRSEIDHDPAITETFNTGLFAGFNALPNSNTSITTPQSINLDFQTGIMADTVAFANVRWVEWSNFSIRPPKFGTASANPAVAASTGKPNGFDLVAYSDDQISATVGVGRKLSEQWASNVSVGWDSGAGNPVTTLGPTEGYWNVGLGLQFSPAPNYFIAGGVKYFWLGDADAQSGAQFNTPVTIAKFEDNDALAYGLKMGYRF
ncbi:OmpP1/FadL family transporter [Acinetobacter terrestris]|uniref:OmpP1/FadL family transporter n=1 Tax=Acinetobacter terrestris TaxID=2529843 RepID=UPI003525255D